MTQSAMMNKTWTTGETAGAVVILCLCTLHLRLQSILTCKYPKHPLPTNISLSCRRKQDRSGSVDSRGLEEEGYSISEAAIRSLCNALEISVTSRLTMSLLQTAWGPPISTKSITTASQGMMQDLGGMIMHCLSDRLDE